MKRILFFVIITVAIASCKKGKDTKLQFSELVGTYTMSDNGFYSDTGTQQYLNTFNSITVKDSANRLWVQFGEYYPVDSISYQTYPNNAEAYEGKLSGFVLKDSMICRFQGIRNTSVPVGISLDFYTSGTNEYKGDLYYVKN